MMLGLYIEYLRKISLMDPQILQAELETGGALTNRITKRVDLQLKAFEISVKFTYLYFFFCWVNFRHYLPCYNLNQFIKCSYIFVNIFSFCSDNV